MKLSTTYKTTGGETFSFLSRRYFGTATKSSDIRASNPGINEPFTPGITIIVPKSINDTLRNQSGVTVNIDGKKFTNFTEININRIIDGVDTISMVAPFIKGQFQKNQFNDVSVYIDGELIFKGTLLTPIPSSSDNGTSLTLSAYSKPGVLQDCNLTPRFYKNKDLNFIATDILKGFGISVSGLTGEKFKYIEYRGEMLWEFLSGLAKQKNKILSNTPEGNLKFLNTSSKGEVVANLKYGVPPVLGVTPSFNPRALYSEITAKTQDDKYSKGSKLSVKTDITVFRPKYIELNDIKKTELKPALNGMVGRMIANSESYSVEVSTWTNEQGELWTEGDLVTLSGDEIFLEEPTKFMIRDTPLSQNDGKTTILNLIDPGAFSE